MAVQLGEGRPTYMRAFAPFVVGAVFPMVIGAILFASLGHAIPDHTAFDQLREDEAALRRQLLQLREDLSRRRLACRPPAVQAAVVPPVQAPAAPVETSPEQSAPSVAEVPSEPVEPPKPQQLTLPEEAMKQNKLDFLEGCWISENELHNSSSGNPIIKYYCFGSNGSGHVIRTDASGLRCRGKISAKISGESIAIKEGESSCNNRSVWNSYSVVCVPSAESRTAICSGKRKDSQWTASFRRAEGSP